MNNPHQEDIERGVELCDAGELDDAYNLANKWLSIDPNDYPAMVLMCSVMIRSNRAQFAYQFAKRLTQLQPKDAASWINLGKACDDLQRDTEAERAYRRALSVCNSDKFRRIILINISALLIENGKYKKAEHYIEEVLKVFPDNKKALANLGFCQLAQRKWVPGWENYGHTAGHVDWRKKQQYGDEPEWDGKKKGNVVLYGEQGLGDELSFASMVPDAAKHANIILDVDFRLANLLQRSFPDVKVYGTRGQSVLDWQEKDTKVAASLPMGQVGQFYRLKDSDFPGTPYLVPDPDRVTMWNALLDGKKRPAIGIAWRGGIPRTGAKYRQWDLEQLTPLLTAVDAHWVSLQYKRADKEIAIYKAKHPDVDLVEYQHGTLTADYDDTAALVASLDMVICMQTAVGHLAGGLGTPAWVFVPVNSQWRYGGPEHEDMLWYNSVKLIRQGKQGQWAKEIEKAAEDLRAYLPGISKRTTRAA